MKMFLPIEGTLICVLHHIREEFTKRFMEVYVDGMKTLTRESSNSKF